MYDIPPEFEPDRQYDRYCYEQEKALLERMKNTKCKDCGRSRIPGDDDEFDEYADKLCFCTEHWIFVDPELTAYDQECEEVESIY